MYHVSAQGVDERMINVHSNNNNNNNKIKIKIITTTITITVVIIIIVIIKTYPVTIRGALDVNRHRKSESVGFCRRP